MTQWWTAWKVVGREVQGWAPLRVQGWALLRPPGLAFQACLVRRRLVHPLRCRHPTGRLYPLRVLRALRALLLLHP